MPAVKRRVFNLLAAVSLLLCVATAALWVRSYIRYDRVDAGQYYQLQIRSADGELSIRLLTSNQLAAVPHHWQSLNPRWFEAAAAGDERAMETALARVSLFYEEP